MSEDVNMIFQVDETLIGERIKEKRKAKGMSQEKLYEKTGIQNTTISAFENGKRIPGLQALAAIAQALDTTIDELYFGPKDTAFIVNAPNRSVKIANCIRELVAERIIQFEVDYQKASENYGYLKIVDYQEQLARLIKNLDQLYQKKDTYSDPDGFSDQIVESVANEIEMVDKDRESERIMRDIGRK